jgi:hypothetical protein
LATGSQLLVSKVLGEFFPRIGQLVLLSVAVPDLEFLGTSADVFQLPGT